MSRRMRCFLTGLALGLSGAAWTTPARAQAGGSDPRVGTRPGKVPQISGVLTLSAQVGVAVTLGRLVSDTVLVMRQVGAAVLGVTADYAFTAALGLEATMAWSPSMVAVRDWQQTVDREAGVLLGSLRLRFAASPKPQYLIVVAPGIGFVDRSGPAWQRIEGTRNAAFVLGAGVEFAGSSALSYGLEMQSYVSRGGYRDAIGTEFDSRLRNDLLLTFSLRYAALGR